MNIFQRIALWGAFLAVGTAPAAIPTASDLSLETGRGISGFWVPGTGFELEHLSFYTKYIGPRALVYLNFEIEKTTASGQIVPTWIYLFRYVRSNKHVLFGMAQSRPSAPRSNKQRAELSPPSPYQRYDISAEGDTLRINIFNQSENAETLADEIVIDLTQQEDSNRQNFLDAGEHITRWKRYSISSHSSRNFRVDMGWVATTPASEHPRLSSAPDLFVDFEQTAAAYKTSLAVMSDDELKALTEESLQESLEYGSVPTGNRAAADALIADILTTAALYTSDAWNFRSHMWTRQEDGSLKAGTAETGCYQSKDDAVYDEEAATAALSYHITQDTHNESWLYDAVAHDPHGEMGNWLAQSNNLSLTYRTETGIAANTQNDAEGQSWNYQAANMTWTNTLSHIAWSYNTESKTWQQAVMEADCESTSTCEWRYDARNQTWTNVSLGDVWRKEHGTTWVKVGGVATPEGGFTENWSQNSNEVWSNNTIEKGARVSASGCGAWTEEETGTLWRWNTSADCVRGIWIKGRNEDLQLCTYDDATQRWDNSGVTEFPPPLLPPFVVTTHNDMIVAYNSLQLQGVL